MLFQTSQFERSSRASLRFAAFGGLFRQCRFRNDHIFNILQPPRMTLHPETASSQSKNEILNGPLQSVERSARHFFKAKPKNKGSLLTANAGSRPGGISL